MSTPLKTIENLGIPTDSYIAAVMTINGTVGMAGSDPIVMTKGEYEANAAEIIGLTNVPVFADEKLARVYFIYAVQETVRAFNDAGANIPDMDEVWAEVERRVVKFKAEHPWYFKDYAEEKRLREGGEVKLDAVGKPKQKKGAKKQQAFALYQTLNGTTDRAGIIKAFMDDIGMTKAGATTYFHNCKKEFGFKEPKAE